MKRKIITQPKKLDKDKITLMEELMLHNWSVKLPIFLRITKMIFNFKYHWWARMMPSTSVPFIWDLHQVSQPELSSILVPSIWLLLPSSATMKQLETTNLKNTTHCQVVSWPEIKCTKDARPWLTTCINQNLTRFCPRPPQSWPMDQLNFKASSGKTIHASSH